MWYYSGLKVKHKDFPTLESTIREIYVGLKEGRAEIFVSLDHGKESEVSMTGVSLHELEPLPGREFPGSLISYLSYKAVREEERKTA